MKNIENIEITLQPMPKLVTKKSRKIIKNHVSLRTIEVAKMVPSQTTRPFLRPPVTTAIPHAPQHEGAFAGLEAAFDYQR